LNRDREFGVLMRKRCGAGRPADMTTYPMKTLKRILGTSLALIPLLIGFAEGAKAPARRPTPARGQSSPGGPIALVADRRVEEADIQRAGLVMERDPLRKGQPALWRKKLLELCVDRELLALEAERTGLLNDRAVKHRIERLSSDLLYAELRERALLAEIAPTAAEVDTARAGGLFRRVKIAFILAVTDRQTTFELAEALRKGADFDSAAALYSNHPSAAQRGELGWRPVASLNPKSYAAFKTAKPGDILGPYPNAQAHEFYKVEAIEDPDDKEIRNTMVKDRAAQLDLRYTNGLLRKYHFKLIPTEVSPVMFAAATEPIDSILASLDAAGVRPKRGVRPSLGVIARGDGDSITYLDISAPEVLIREADGKGKIEDTQQLGTLCVAAILPRLIARDARERGIDRDPAIARRLRLLREEESTRAMVERAVTPPDPAQSRAYFDSHPERFLRPSARRALIATFASEDTARMALSGWSRKAFRDSVFSVEGFGSQENATAPAVFPRLYAEMPLFDTDNDPLSSEVRALEEGRSSVIRVPNGYAVALALGREPARALTYEEVAMRVAPEAREDAENAWVMRQLERLRAATPARAVPARLAAVRLGTSTDTGGKRR
jgi:hypothetical protein